MKIKTFFTEHKKALTVAGMTVFILVSIFLFAWRLKSLREDDENKVYTPHPGYGELLPEETESMNGDGSGSGGTSFGGRGHDDVSLLPEFHPYPNPPNLLKPSFYFTFADGGGNPVTFDNFLKISNLQYPTYRPCGYILVERKYSTTFIYQLVTFWVDEKDLPPITMGLLASGDSSLPNKMNIFSLGAFGLIPNVRFTVTTLTESFMIDKPGTGNNVGVFKLSSGASFLSLNVGNFSSYVGSLWYPTSSGSKNTWIDGSNQYGYIIATTRDIAHPDVFGYTVRSGDLDNFFDYFHPSNLPPIYAPGGTAVAPTPPPATTQPPQPTSNPSTGTGETQTGTTQPGTNPTGGAQGGNGGGGGNGGLGGHGGVGGEVNVYIDNNNNNQNLITNDIDITNDFDASNNIELAGTGKGNETETTAFQLPTYPPDYQPPTYPPPVTYPLPVGFQPPNVPISDTLTDFQTSSYNFLSFISYTMSFLPPIFNQLLLFSFSGVVLVIVAKFIRGG